jgi:hypothetical protein
MRETEGSLGLYLGEGNKGELPFLPRSGPAFIPRTSKECPPHKPVNVNLVTSRSVRAAYLGRAKGEALESNGNGRNWLKTECGCL